MQNNSNIDKKAWLVTVDMGYGHQRTAHSLRDIAPNRTVINANSYRGVPYKDRKIWHTTRTLYEFISRFRSIPIIGVFLFLFMDSFQQILGYYPKRDLSKSSVSGKNVDHFIRRGWGADLIKKLSKNPLPFVTTFFTTAFMAEHFNYPNDIYCIICDADIARTWVALEPKKSRIKYFASNDWTRDRLKLYGVKPENIVLTGYPLPKENLGGENLEILKKDLRYRLLNLDPNGNYRKLYAPLIKNYLGELPKLPNHPFTILFSIGGAGAQKEVALAIINSLKNKIKAKQLRFIVSIGVREELRQYFADNVKDLELDGWLHILSAKTAKEYFEEFNRELRKVDILMTKPSELSFFGALGIPIIIEPSIGSQEDFNRRWLLHVGVGVSQENPAYTDQWLYDLLEAGDFAEMAMQGFVEMEKLGTYNIEKIIKEKK